MRQRGSGREEAVDAIASSRLAQSEPSAIRGGLKQMDIVVSYLAPTEAHHVRVDPTASQKLRVEFDGTLHALTCGQVNLDAMDVAGEQQELL
ncbi:hypothetical protein FNF28_06011 [Cafeteria roenbergensis]|uniref:Endoplasmic reticulum vesicle transporter N-terminal domain-containing protein n=1 Tax=Cafeteria roenbergensis TaxID=33653 RepID=A0A5A8D339_CAFRO|nr:hypothetical protein FNF28_06011 [Cafeteria roenbergensis]